LSALFGVLSVIGHKGVMGCNKRGLEGSKTLVKSFNSSAVTLVVFSPMQDPDKTDPLTGNARYIQPHLFGPNIWMRSHCLGCSLAQAVVVMHADMALKERRFLILGGEGSWSSSMAIIMVRNKAKACSCL